MNISRSLLQTGVVDKPMATYIFGIGGEASKTDRKHELDAWGTLGDISHYGAGEGKKNTGAAGDYWQAILSGDQKKIAQASSPQTSVIQGQAQQQKNQLAEFGNRSGGTNAGSQMIDTEADKAVMDLINTLIPQAATNLANLGTNELSLGESAAGTLGQQTEAARQADKASEFSLGKTLGGIAKAGLSFIPGFGTVSQILSGVSKQPNQ